METITIEEKNKATSFKRLHNSLLIESTGNNTDDYSFSNCCIDLNQIEKINYQYKESKNSSSSVGVLIFVCLLFTILAILGYIYGTEAALFILIIPAILLILFFCTDKTKRKDGQLEIYDHQNQIVYKQTIVLNPEQVLEIEELIRNI